MSLAPFRLHLIATLLLAGCSSSGSEQGDVDFATTVLEAEIPAELSAGAATFDANCASCHGNRGLGSAQGPPLVHIIYEPSHHGDLAFLLAAERGVRAHHWQFGDMPPRPEVSRDAVLDIVAYIRFLQRQVGIG